MRNKKNFLINMFLIIFIICTLVLNSTKTTKKIAISKIEKMKVGANEEEILDTELAKIISPSNYGDWAEYKIDLNDDGNIQNDWKIFYNDSTNVFLIAADYIPVGKIPNGADMTTINAYEAYWSGSTSYANKSGMVDISEDIAKKFMINKYKSSAYGTSSLENAKATATLLDTNIWEYFAGGIEGSQATGGATIEMFAESWKQKEYSEIDYSNLSAYGYGSPMDKDVKNDEGYNDTLYFPHKDSYENCDAYWLASPTGQKQGSAEQIGNIIIQCNGSITYEGVEGKPYTSVAIRPIVCLPTNLKGYKSDDDVWKLGEQKHIITTEVSGIGGTITDDGKDVCEEVIHGEDSVKDIIVEPDDGYYIQEISINGEKIEFQPNEDGSYIMEKFVNMTEDKHIVVKFAKIEQVKEENTSQDTNTSQDMNKDKEIDNTVKKDGILPNTGIGELIFIVTLTVVLSAFVFYKRYNDLK